MAVAKTADSAQSDLLTRVFAQEVQETPWLDRSNSRAELHGAGLPMPWKGRWQYTDYQALIESALMLEASGDALQSCDGVEVSHLEQPTSDAETIVLNPYESVGEFPLMDVNGLLFRSGTKLNATTQMAHASIIDATGSVDRHLISVAEDAKLRIEESFQSGNRVALCYVRENATLEYELTMPQGEEPGYHCIVVWLEADSTLRLHLASKGSRVRRNDVIVNTIGKNASATLSGGWLVDDRDHLDTQVYMNHRVGSTHSEQSFHGVVDDRARSAFSGFIRIDRDASAAEAHLTNRNIALSPHARAHAQPELEIYTDDVICSHGATTGHLDADSLFMMRSRGIDEDSARTMLTKGFLRQVVHSESGSSLLQL